MFMLLAWKQRLYFKVRRRLDLILSKLFQKLLSMDRGFWFASQILHISHKIAPCDKAEEI